LKLTLTGATLIVTLILPDADNSQRQAARPTWQFNGPEILNLWNTRAAGYNF
jgi:hypothetical protein